MPSIWNTDKTSFTAGHFELSIDGHPTTAYLKSVDGGYVKQALVDEGVGGDLHRAKHASVAEIDPISFEFGIAGANNVLKWIQQSWSKEWSRRNGVITHADFNLNKQIEHEFYEALITETTFPTLDGASKDAAYLKVKVQPEKVITKVNPSSQKIGQATGNGQSKQKMWMCSGFRLNIQDIDEMKFANKIDSFTIKQGVKKLYVGSERYPTIEPTKIEFPHITGTIAVSYADKLFKWYEDYVVKGKRDPKAQRTGSIEFLSTDRSKTLFEIDLYEVGLISLSVMQSTANSDQIKRVKFELYVGRMDLDGKGLGLD
ncbi:MAG: phage tail protein [Deltaproteobacteria bacterium]|nr:phage tail protein [Deltaproteobacteria bacterium]